MEDEEAFIDWKKKRNNSNSTVDVEDKMLNP